MARKLARKRVAVLISGRGSNMTALVEAARAPDYPAEIVLVVSNRADAAGLATAQSAGIATAVVEHSAYRKDREGFERALDAAIRTHDIDVICLAGFMRVLTTHFLDRWPNRILNIHPALLPSFKGLDTHARALSAGVKIHGATVHVVAPGMDSGPIVVQGAVPVRDNDTEDALAARVLAVEHKIYPLALRLFAEDRVEVVGDHCVIDGVTGPRIIPFD